MQTSPLLLSPLLSVRLALFTCWSLWKPAGGNCLSGWSRSLKCRLHPLARAPQYVECAWLGHTAFIITHVASPHCGRMFDRSNSAERSALVHNSRRYFTVGRHGSGSSLVHDSSTSVWHQPGNNSMGIRAWLQPPKAYHYGLMFIS